MESTVADFWRMIVEKKVKAIVMLANFYQLDQHGVKKVIKFFTCKINVLILISCFYRYNAFHIGMIRRLKNLVNIK